MQKILSMSYSIKTLAKFDKNLKALVKKYPSLKVEFIELVKSLKTNPIQGTLIGHNCYKIRLSIASKGKGKSGGARVITNVIVTEKIVYLISIYDKSDKETLNNKELKELLNEINE
jgi:mRNA-degrading endonuclease RelE of RelBE toxin-antitoxin system